MTDSTATIMRLRSDLEEIDRQGPLIRREEKRALEEEIQTLRHEITLANERVFFHINQKFAEMGSSHWREMSVEKLSADIERLQRDLQEQERHVARERAMNHVIRGQLAQTLQRVQDDIEWRHRAEERLAINESRLELTLGDVTRRTEEAMAMFEDERRKIAATIDTIASSHV